MANGAKELLDEVATGKVTGEEEGVQPHRPGGLNANVEGALKAYELLKPVVAEKDAELAKTLDQEFAALKHPARQVQPGRVPGPPTTRSATPSARPSRTPSTPGRAALQARRRDRRQLKSESPRARGAVMTEQQETAAAVATTTEADAPAGASAAEP
ncbi:hypothetical protein GCM10020229_60510 [Kitasatospora albolonga]|uniref:imelysin family protein n=1 Tax=Kitasatospora albolonga TaxID=68173 RepID=UPI00337466E2